MNVRELMTPLVESVGPDDTLRDASEKMNAFDLDPLPVTESGRLVGVLTHAALTQRAAQDGLAAGSTKVRDVMSNHTVCVQQDMDVSGALDQLGNDAETRRFSRIPVIDARGELVGSVTVETLRQRLQADEAPNEGEAAVFGVESVSSVRDFNEDRVAFMSDESFPASDPMPPPTALGEHDDEPQ
jgi:CBS domain-containing protein